MLPCYREGVSSSLDDFYNEMSELVVQADLSGWDRVWISEDHFHYYGGAAPIRQFSFRPGRARPKISD